MCIRTDSINTIFVTVQIVLNFKIYHILPHSTTATEFSTTGVDEEWESEQV